MIKKFLTSTMSLVVTAYSAVDMRDVFVFGGLSMLGYGLSMFQPWVGISVSGALLMALGLGFLTRGPAK